LLRKFHLREVVSINQFGIRSHGCPWCHTDLTDNIRAHLYGCAMLPVAVRRRAQAAREAARNLVKQSHQLRDAADVARREAEDALHALRETMRQSPIRTALADPRPRPTSARRD
jgi:Spy/CpxP family protein refolding chaperone